MSNQVFVQNQPHNDYQAMVIGLPDCAAEGKIEEEAVASPLTEGRRDRTGSRNVMIRYVPGTEK